MAATQPSPDPSAPLRPTSAAGGIHHEPTAKRIRAVLAGRTILDSTSARLVWEHPYYPQYYAPVDDVADGVLTPSPTTGERERFGPARYFNVRAGGREVADGAWQYPEAGDELGSLVRFAWDAADAWFEEDVEVHVHPRSPYVRVDVLDSSRHIRVEIDGVTVADSTHAKILFETGLPARYYLPKVDVRFDLLEATDLVTACPYKGIARYWTAVIDGKRHENIVWGYDAPLPESVGVAGLVCFYAEKAELYLDGELVGV
jgi:uncharacterized protein (DUF427 family)